MKTLTTLACAAAVLLSGCASTFTLEQEALKVFNKEPQPVDMRQVVGAGLSEEGVAYMDTPVPKPIAVNAPLSEPFPAIEFKEPLNLYGASLSDALTQVLAGTDVGLMLMPGTPANASAQIRGLRGNLTSVLNVLSEAYGVYFTYSRGVLTVEPDRQYLIELPPLKGLVASVEKVLAQRGATAVSVDAVSGHVSYRASYPVARSVEGYLDVALNQPLLVMELNVIEVRLNNASQTGIQWNKFTFTGGLTSAAAVLTTPSIARTMGTLGLTGNLGDKLSLDVLLKFLATQGTVNTVSQPRVQFLSGGKTELKIGDTIRYVSKIGASQVGTTGVAQTTAEVTNLDTGIKLVVGGTYWQDTVVAKLELEMSELLGFDTIATGTNQALQLPRTTKRELGSAAEPVVLRLRPGETGLLAGLITTKNTRTREGLTNAPLLGELGTTGLNTAKERNELVIVVRPKVIKFGKPPAATPESGAPA